MPSMTPPSRTTNGCGCASAVSLTTTTEGENPIKEDNPQRAALAIESGKYRRDRLDEMVPLISPLTSSPQWAGW